MDEFKSCPFCGSEAQLCVFGWIVHKEHYGVRCLSCLAQTMDFYETKAEAIEAWNTRYERTTPADKLLCRHCGYSIVYQDGDDVYTWDYCPHCGARIVD